MQIYEFYANLQKCEKRCNNANLRTNANLRKCEKELSIMRIYERMLIYENAKRIDRLFAYIVFAKNSLYLHYIYEN